MNWSDLTWEAIEDCFQSILAMPFITELSEGSLPKEKFQFYMAQDSLYLDHFGRALSLIGARADNIDQALSYIRFAENALIVENVLHDSYFRDFGITSKGTMEPTCHHYVHFLKSTASLEAVEIAMAATLPCFWIYKRVGDYILSQPQLPNNPYQQWINTYGGEEFAIAVDRAIAICNQAASQTTLSIRNKMTEAFITASRMEYQFWQAAYELRKWE